MPATTEVSGTHGLNRPRSLAFPRSNRLPLLILGFAITSLAAALVAARIQGPNGPWLWAPDMPFFDYPLASFFHDALTAGHLPMWNDNLALGFPLYAEGQIGAFYPPNWLIFQLPPLTALDVARVVHLVWLGVGTGLLALRLSGSRMGAVMAAGAIVLSGGIVTKLEWTNVVEGFAWVPWILIPLVRRPHPSRPGLVAAGVMWGVVVLTGHPNIWMLTGLTAAAVVLAIRPRPDSILRLIGLGLIAAGIGAVQLVPSALLYTLSVRATGLDRDDLFRLTAMPFDMLGTAFANIFVRADGSSVNLNSTWYPGGTWSPLEVGAYVGLPLLALAAVALPVRRARPLIVAAIVLIALPIIGGQRPDWWAALPIWNGLHAPVKGYMFLDLMLVLLAAIGLGRLGRRRGGWRAPAVMVAVLVLGYAAVAGTVLLAPGLFAQLVDRYWNYLPAGSAQIVRLADDTLRTGWPVLLEIGLGVTAVAVIFAALRKRQEAWSSPVLIVLVLAPLFLLSPAYNSSQEEPAFTYQASLEHRSIAAERPTHVLTMGAPFFSITLPDQLATSGIPDVQMFSSLNFGAGDELLGTMRSEFPDVTTARAVGVDTVVTYGLGCPGLETAGSPGDISICRVQALKPPYWIPASAVHPDRATQPSPIRPRDADIDVGRALSDSVAARTIARTDSRALFAVNAPAAGWVFLDRSWWPAWQTTVDDTPQQPIRALSGQLIEVTAGPHVIRQTFVPWDAALGLVIGIGTAALALLWILIPRLSQRRRSGRPPDSEVDPQRRLP